MAGNVRGLACFPLVPFSNRIAYGGSTGTAPSTCWTAISETIRTQSTALAGSRWVVAAVDRVATLTLRHDAGGRSRAWPFAFAAEQRLVLTPDALTSH